MALVEHNHQMALIVLVEDEGSGVHVCLCLMTVFSLPFQRFDMPAHGDWKFRDEWLVQDKYKEWVVNDGDPRLARKDLIMRDEMSSDDLIYINTLTKRHHCVAHRYACFGEAYSLELCTLEPRFISAITSPLRSPLFNHK